MSKTGQVIIIKKKSGHKHAPHGGAWKVAYADFVTAMMAFFLVLWIIGQSRAVKASIAGYFRDPGIFDQQKSTGVIAGGDFRLDPESDSRVKPVPIPAGVSEVKRSLESVGKGIREMLGKMPEFKMMMQHLDIQMTSEGLRIELTESAESSFFDTGSAVLKGESEKMLATIAAELAEVRNPVVIEGHTDSRAYRGATEMYTNWELAADRANAARRVLQRSGLHPSQIRGVRGYADTQLKYPEAPLDPRNRRVSIVVQDLPEGIAKQEEQARQAAHAPQAQPGASQGAPPPPPPNNGQWQIKW
jgi:chemotaxis protein MotB